jgi:DNA-binding transcriptional regulator YiaG
MTAGPRSAGSPTCLRSVSARPISACSGTGTPNSLPSALGFVGWPNLRARASAKPTCIELTGLTALQLAPRLCRLSVITAHAVLLSHTMTVPTSQSELLRRARGALSQAAFARQLGVDRTCLCRYESEALGAPTAVLNKCLRILAAGEQDSSKLAVDPAALSRALTLSRELTLALEDALSAQDHQPPTSRSRP